MKDEGFATVVVLALCGVLAAAGGLVAVLGEVAVARHEAASAADLAALAGADRAWEGAGPACTAAAAVARLNRATLTTCALQGQDIEVTVVVAPVGAVARWGTARSRSRAGPGTARGSRASSQGRG